MIEVLVGWVYVWIGVGAAVGFYNNAPEEMGWIKWFGVFVAGVYWPVLVGCLIVDAHH